MVDAEYRGNILYFDGNKYSMKNLTIINIKTNKPIMFVSKISSDTNAVIYNVTGVSRNINGYYEIGVDPDG